MGEHHQRGSSRTKASAVYALYAGRTAVSPKISAFLEFLTDLAARIFADPTLIRLTN